MPAKCHIAKRLPADVPNEDGQRWVNSSGASGQVDAEGLEKHLQTKGNEDYDEKHANLVIGDQHENAGPETGAQYRTERDRSGYSWNDIAAHEIGASAGRGGDANHEIGSGGRDFDG